MSNYIESTFMQFVVLYPYSIPYCSYNFDSIGQYSCYINYDYQLHCNGLQLKYSIDSVSSSKIVLTFLVSEELTAQTEELSLESKTVFDNKEEFTAKHPLSNRWTLWYTKPQVNKNENWHDLLKPVITFSSVEEFWGIYNSIPVANQLPLKSDYHLFKEGIRPEWEDEQNAQGGKWQYSFNNKRDAAGVINELWLRGLLSVIGETIEDDENEVNGIVLNIRKQAFRVGIWTKDCDVNKLKTVGERLKKVLQLREEQKVEFISHDASNKKGSASIVL